MEYIVYRYNGFVFFLIREYSFSIYLLLNFIIKEINLYYVYFLFYGISFLRLVI